MNQREPLLIVGNPEDIHVGAHFLRGARRLGIGARLLDVRRAFDASCFVRVFNWRLRGHRPPRLREFSAEVVETYQVMRPAQLVAVGLAPISSDALDAAGQLGVRRLNFLTDDPWSPAQRAPWFMDALRRYDHVFTPRRANMADLRRHGCREVSYLPFAYCPELHFPEPSEEPGWDIIFAGGADRDRVPWIAALIREGVKVGLYGGYWERFPETRAHARGHLGPAALRRSISASKISLGLVRRANRDGHCMRTFEVPAMGGCMLTEDTEEHRELFGEDGECVRYFRTVPELIDTARWLLRDDHERSRLAAAAHNLIATSRHTYADRLETMLSLAPCSVGHHA